MEPSTQSVQPAVKPDDAHSDISLPSQPRLSKRSLRTRDNLIALTDQTKLSLGIMTRNGELRLPKALRQDPDEVLPPRELEQLYAFKNCICYGILEPVRLRLKELPEELKTPGILAAKKALDKLLCRPSLWDKEAPYKVIHRAPAILDSLLHHLDELAPNQASLSGKGEAAVD